MTSTEALAIVATARANGERPNLSYANLSYANLSYANLIGANLSDANLRGANLSDANLRGADFSDAYLIGADLSGADLSDANLSGANLRGADFSGAIGIATAEEEEANLSAAIAAIAAEPANWSQEIWHDENYKPDEAPAVGSCGSAHCLAGWMQALLPLGHELRKVEPAIAGSALAPRAAGAGWFNPTIHPDLQARVDAARAKFSQQPQEAPLQESR